MLSRLNVLKNPFDDWVTAKKRKIATSATYTTYERQSIRVSRCAVLDRKTDESSTGLAKSSPCLHYVLENLLCTDNLRLRAPSPGPCCLQPVLDLSPVDVLHDAPLPHHQDAIGDSEQLGQLRGNDDD